MDENILAEEERPRSEAEHSSKRRSEARPSRSIKSMEPVEQMRMTPDMVSAIAREVVFILQSSSSGESTVRMDPSGIHSSSSFEQKLDNLISAVQDIKLDIYNLVYRIEELERCSSHIDMQHQLGEIICTLRVLQSAIERESGGIARQNILSTRLATVLQNIVRIDQQMNILVSSFLSQSSQPPPTQPSSSQPSSSRPSSSIHRYCPIVQADPKD